MMEDMNTPNFGDNFQEYLPFNSSDDIAFPKWGYS